MVWFSNCVTVFEKRGNVVTTLYILYCFKLSSLILHTVFGSRKKSFAQRCLGGIYYRVSFSYISIHVGFSPNIVFVSKTLCQVIWYLQLLNQVHLA